MGNPLEAINEDFDVTLPGYQWVVVATALQAYIPTLPSTAKGTRTIACAALQNIDAQMRGSDELAPLDDLMGPI